jgi:hypothetical protein
LDLSLLFVCLSFKQVILATFGLLTFVWHNRKDKNRVQVLIDVTVVASHLIFCVWLGFRLPQNIRFRKDFQEKKQMDILHSLYRVSVGWNPPIFCLFPRSLDGNIGGVLPRIGPVGAMSIFTLDLSNESVSAVLC